MEDETEGMLSAWVSVLSEWKLFNIYADNGEDIKRMKMLQNFFNFYLNLSLSIRFQSIRNMYHTHKPLVQASHLHNFVILKIRCISLCWDYTLFGSTI